jgi:hypothetical protein
VVTRAAAKQDYTVPVEGKATMAEAAQRQIAR